MKSRIPATVLALSGAAVLFALPAALRAADETPHDAVERLMPQLLSDDETARSDAERSVFQLGEAGRAELERVTREGDPRKAITALRLLQSPKWAKAAKSAGEKPSGEQRLQRDNDNLIERDGADKDDDPNDRIEDLRAQMEREMSEMRKRFEQFDQGFAFKMPQMDTLGRNAFAGESSGSVVENDKKTSWNVGKDGRIKVTIQDGKDAPEQTFEGKDLDELKKEHPEVAARVEPMLGGNGRSFVFRLGDPDQRAQLFGRSGGLRHRVDPFQLDAPQTPVLGIEWSAVPDVLRDQVDLPEGGMVIESVVKDSLAEKLGLAKHDVLVEINGKPVSGSPDVRTALDAVKAGETVKAVVVRKGQKKTLEAVK